jgi:hypothetical protein
MRLLYLATLFGIAALWAPAPLRAQVYTIYPPGIIKTPHVHLGSDTDPSQPSVVEIPPAVVEQPGLPPNYGPDEYGPEEYEAEAPPYPPMSFDYLVAPTGEFFPGSMADTSISLGEYARELRSHKGEGPPPVHLDVNPSQTQ